MRTIEWLGVLIAVPEQVKLPSFGSTPRILPLVRVTASVASSTRRLDAEASRRGAGRGREPSAAPAARSSAAPPTSIDRIADSRQLGSARHSATAISITGIAVPISLPLAPAIAGEYCQMHEKVR